MIFCRMTSFIPFTTLMFISPSGNSIFDGIDILPPPNPWMCILFLTIRFGSRSSWVIVSVSSIDGGGVRVGSPFMLAAMQVMSSSLLFSFLFSSHGVVPSMMKLTSLMNILRSHRYIRYIGLSPVV